MVIREIMDLKEITTEGYKIVFRAMAHEVDTVAEASDLVMEEVEVDLIKVQTSSHM